MRVEYRSNNSGGNWWLTDDDWKALEAAGWVVQWVANDPFFKFYELKDGRWLGALAKVATRHGLPLREAANEWEKVTGKDSTDAGCPCCGQPHSFTEYDDEGKWVASGPEASYEAHW